MPRHLAAIIAVHGFRAPDPAQTGLIARPDTQSNAIKPNQSRTQFCTRADSPDPPGHRQNQPGALIAKIQSAIKEELFGEKVKTVTIGVKRHPDLVG